MLYVTNNPDGATVEVLKKAFELTTRQLRISNTVPKLNGRGFVSGVFVDLSEGADDVARNVRKQHATMPVIALSQVSPPKIDKPSQGDEADQILFYRAGGDRVVSSLQPRLLLEHYEAVTSVKPKAPNKERGVNACDNAIISAGTLKLHVAMNGLQHGERIFSDFARAQPERYFKSGGFTNAEILLLEALMKTPGRIFPKESIRGLVRTHDKMMELASVDTSIKRLRYKLYPFLGIDKNDTCGPIETIYGLGICLNTDKIPTPEQAKAVIARTCRVELSQEPRGMHLAQ